MFSFGIVLWEILTGEEPYANMHYGAIIGMNLLLFPQHLTIETSFVSVFYHACSRSFIAMAK